MSNRETERTTKDLAAGTTRRSFFARPLHGQASAEELERGQELRARFVPDATITGEGGVMAALVVAERQGAARALREAVYKNADIFQLTEAVQRLEVLLAQSDGLRALQTNEVYAVESLEPPEVTPPTQPTTLRGRVRRQALLFVPIGVWFATAGVLTGGAIYGEQRSFDNEDKNIKESTVGLNPFPPSPEGWTVNYLPSSNRVFEPINLDDGLIRLREGERIRFSKLDLRQSTDLAIEAYFNPNRPERKIVRLATYNGVIRQTSLHLPENHTPEIDDRALHFLNTNTGEEHFMAVQPYFAGRSYQDSTFDLTLVRPKR